MHRREKNIFSARIIGVECHRICVIYTFVFTVHRRIVHFYLHHAWKLYGVIISFNWICICSGKFIWLPSTTVLFDDDEYKLSTIRVFLFQLKTEIYLWTADNIEIFLITSTVGWHYYYYYQEITELHVQSAKRTGVTKELISPLMHSIRTHYKTHIRLSPIHLVGTRSVSKRNHHQQLFVVRIGSELL